MWPEINTQILKITKNEILKCTTVFLVDKHKMLIKEIDLKLILEYITKAVSAEKIMPMVLKGVGLHDKYKS